MKLDRGFADFLKMQGKWKLVLLITLAALLIFIGSFGGRDTNDDSTPELEERLAELCSMTEGAGECRVMITYTDDNRVYAVAVLCDGTDSVHVKENLTSLICSLFGIGANRVEIIKISSR